MSDILIASLCLEHGLFLYTIDAHFLEIPKIKLWHKGIGG